MKRVFVLFFMVVSIGYSCKYSVEDIQQVANKKYSRFDTKISLFLNSYKEDDRYDPGVGLSVNLYDSNAIDARKDKIDTFINESMKLRESIIFSKARIALLMEKKNYYISLSKIDEKEALARNKAINNSYIDRIFEIKGKLFEEKHNLNLAENVLRSRMGD